MNFGFKGFLNPSVIEILLAEKFMPLSTWTKTAKPQTAEMCVTQNVSEDSLKKGELKIPPKKIVTSISFEVD